MEYSEIKKANDEIVKMDIKGKGYSPVNERVLAFKKVYENGKIFTNIERIEENYILMKASIYDGETLISTGYASESKEQNKTINFGSMVENCETSAVGRALGFAGFGIDKGIASGEDMKKIDEQEKRNKKIEIFDNVFISEVEAIKIVKVAINNLIRIQGVILDDLKKEVRKQTWTELEELNYQQLGMLERKLSTINNTTSDWHHIYNQNSKIKDVAPVNTTIIYKSSLYTLGKIALKHFEDDELKQSEVIDYYLDSGIDIRKEI